MPIWLIFQNVSLNNLHFDIRIGSQQSKYIIYIYYIFGLLWTYIYIYPWTNLGNLTNPNGYNMSCVAPRPIDSRSLWRRISRPAYGMLPLRRPTSGDFRKQTIPRALPMAGPAVIVVDVDQVLITLEKRTTRSEELCGFNCRGPSDHE